MAMKKGEGRMEKKMCPLWWYWKIAILQLTERSFRKLACIVNSNRTNTLELQQPDLVTIVTNQYKKLQNQHGFKGRELKENRCLSLTERRGGLPEF